MSEFLVVAFFQKRATIVKAFPQLFFDTLELGVKIVLTKVHFWHI